MAGYATINHWRKICFFDLNTARKALTFCWKLFPVAILRWLCFLFEAEKRPAQWGHLCGQLPFSMNQRKMNFSSPCLVSKNHFLFFSFFKNTFVYTKTVIPLWTTESVRTGLFVQAQMAFKHFAFRWRWQCGVSCNTVCVFAQEATAEQNILPDGRKLWGRIIFRSQGTMCLCRTWSYRTENVLFLLFRILVIVLHCLVTVYQSQSWRIIDCACTTTIHVSNKIQWPSKVVFFVFFCCVSPIFVR